MVFSLTSQFAHDARSQNPKAWKTKFCTHTQNVITNILLASPMWRSESDQTCRDASVSEGLLGIFFGTSAVLSDLMAWHSVRLLLALRTPHSMQRDTALCDRQTDRHGVAVTAAVAPHVHARGKWLSWHSVSVQNSNGPACNPALTLCESHFYLSIYSPKYSLCHILMEFFVCFG